jgi:hypothetical protein
VVVAAGGWPALPDDLADHDLGGFGALELGVPVVADVPVDVVPRGAPRTGDLAANGLPEPHGYSLSSAFSCMAM